jgi:DNA-binding transcriptional ArsR family regulator
MKEKYYIMRSGKTNEVSKARVFERPEVMKAVANPLGFRILQTLSTPKCPIDIARNLGEHEQKVYYYINKFRKHGLVEEIRTEKRKGTLAKFYQVTDNAFILKLGEARWERVDTSSPHEKKSLEPFIKHGKIDFTIIIGSPDPHGPWKERALDSPTAIDLALFLGSFAKERITPNYKLDIEIREKDLKGNLILIGGPIVNMVTKRLNRAMPVNFDLKKRDIMSGISKNVYRDDQFGIINLVENPWNRSKKILVFAGKRFPGTRASILAFMSDPEKILRGNRFDRSKISRVVRGYDMDGDGIIDSSEIME